VENTTLSIVLGMLISMQVQKLQGQSNFHYLKIMDDAASEDHVMAGSYLEERNKLTDKKGHFPK
jgi:hypothetical protein